ncbi:DedA family protein [Cellulomonas sp. URHE0023]|uniref:DedA family protein n=1 Tax=Cellulomonas sp. URHE0023 TaxID=1380354 RepID=UPI0004870A4F|nr:VTT domain-containing protein [Cellulomonas sp. URHE0023]
MLTNALAAALPALGPAHSGITDYLDAQHLIDSFGQWVLIGIMAVIFVEVGLLFPILPGDSLLFTAGALVAQDELDVKIGIAPLMALLILAAYAGTQTGYLIGRTAGPKVFAKEDSRFFKQKYIDQTYAYFDRYGGRTLVVAQFIPFVRTYASVAAGVGKMKYRQFALWNLIGVVLWAGGVTLLGYLLGNVPFIKNNIESLLVLVVLFSVLPIFVEVWRKRRRARKGLGVADERDARYDEQSERDEVEKKAFGA